jgi:uncharacterized protein
MVGRFCKLSAVSFMKLQQFKLATEIPRPAREVFRWHERAGALERMLPPWERIEVVQRSTGVQTGQRVKVRQKIGPFAANWEVEHRGYIEDREFRDVAISSPFQHWEHIHRVVQNGPAACTLIDEINFAPPAGFLGRMVISKHIQRELERVFDFRHARLMEDLRAAGVYGAVRPMRILVSGSSGLIGSSLVPFLESQGHEVVRLVRRAPANAHEVFWNPDREELDHHHLRAIDAVIHLAGANVAAGRWTSSRRDEIWNSRIKGTRTLVSAMERLRHRPFVFISASGVGFYGNRGGEELDEASSKGTGFLSDLCDNWEKEADLVGELGIRPVMLRTGVVLTPAGGALARLLPVFKAGLGGKIGNGAQWMSWVSIDDYLGIIYHSLLDQRCVHEVNAVSPEPVTNAEFAATLARVLRRPAVARVPASLLRARFGQMSEETILSSTKVVPQKLFDARYRYRHEHLEDALRFVLGRM